MEFDELWDASDAKVVALHQASPAAYQELQARVRRLHRWFCGLVRVPAEDEPERGVQAVYVDVPVADAAGPADVDLVAEALQECADRFLRPGDASPDPVLAELHLPGRRTVLLRYTGDGADGRAGDLEGELREVLRRLLDVSEEPTPGRLVPA